ncbi:MAG TPA: sulfate ABC transporter permease subunit CysT [Arenimonas sp.]|uniref:sulfate ABC transporter permease subunit CysT n=1 Tax=Arenimonas sp. TaxID=1872635 RepID=UPI002CE583D9|nr:sulfate ABC transporter permease subunit CysT [Arenimonas sp.]HMB56605.1 sulfate ABC transporter permease subunit CysT [Arenimonas sp.]
MSAVFAKLAHPWRQAGPLPGLGLTLGISLTWLSLIVLIPLLALLIKASGLGVHGWWAIASDARVWAAMKLSFGTALLAALIDTVIGGLIAWVLVRYRFPARSFFDALIDLPFALPTAVAGIALTAIYAGNGWLGHWLELAGLKVAYTPVGIIVALLFIGLPFTVRTVQPVLENLHREHEEAAASLGASRFTTLWRVLLPQLAPALLTGFSLAFARGVGEYGSVIFIAGNLPYVSEIAPLLIVIKLDEYDYAGATAIASLMLATSFLILFALNTLQRRLSRGQIL